MQKLNKQVVHRTIRSRRDFDELIDLIVAHSLAIGFDLESTDLDTAVADIIGCSIGFVKDGANYAYYIPVGHEVITEIPFMLVPVGEDCFTIKSTRAPDQISEEYLLTRLLDIFKEKTVSLAGSFLKYDFELLLNRYKKLLGIDLAIRCTVRDTTVSSFMLHLNPKGLKQRVRFDLGYKMKTFEEVCPDPGRARYVDIDVMAPYAADDAIYALLLADCHEQKMRDSIIGDRGVQLFRNLLGPNVFVLATMQYNGVCIDVPVLEKLSNDLKIRISEIESEFFDLLPIPHSINLSSAEQLSRLMFDKLKLWPILPGFKLSDKTDKKSSYVLVPSDVLKDILCVEDLDPIAFKLCELVLEHRALGKLLSTYTVELTTGLCSRGRKHCNLNQTIADTGRLTSSGPNLQNIPVRSKEGQTIRSAFIAESGSVLVGADYSQIELRILAHMAGVSSLINDFNNGGDPHQTTADDLNCDRRAGKTINFGIVYGMGEKKLARTLSVPVKKARKFLDDFAEVRPEITAFKQKQTALARKTGHVKTLLGRTRSFATQLKNDEYIDNMASNTPIQGGAADVMNVAQRNIANWLMDEGLWQKYVRMLLQVHDELLFEVSKDVPYEYNGLSGPEAVKSKIVNIMSTAVSLIVKLEVDAHIGDNWLEIH